MTLTLKRNSIFVFEFFMIVFVEKCKRKRWWFRAWMPELPDLVQDRLAP
jgi:hypothetical protein